MKEILKLLNPKNWKELYRTKRELVMYIIFGIATTAVSYISYFLFRILLPQEFLSSITVFSGETPLPVTLSWVISVAFAYVTNRIFVFKSKKNGFSAIIKEMFFFVLARVLTLFTDMLIMFLLVDLTKIDNLLYELAAKLFSGVIIIILNYIFSKAIVFRNKQEE